MFPRDSIELGAKTYGTVSSVLDLSQKQSESLDPKLTGSENPQPIMFRAGLASGTWYVKLTIPGLLHLVML